MTWTVQRFLKSFASSDRHNQSNQHHQSNQHQQHTSEDSDSDNHSFLSNEEETESDNQEVVRKRMTHENLNQHNIMRKWNYTNKNDNDNDNVSISSYSSLKSIMSTENVKQFYSTRNSDILIIQKAFKAQYDEIKKLKNEKQTLFINLSKEIKKLQSKLQKEIDQKHALQALALDLEREKYSKTNVINSKREIYWDLKFQNNKFSYNSDYFSFLDRVWRINFMKTNNETYGFFIELTHYSDSEKEIALKALFKLHHSFANPYMKAKDQPLLFSPSLSKRGVISFISFENIEYFIQDNNMLKLSVVLELA